METTAATKAKPNGITKKAAGAVLPRDLRRQRRLLFNRELSWLEFNRRVLEEAFDGRHPLLERLKFLAIFSTNLDEFFMVRVSGLQEAMEAGAEPSLDGMKPVEQLKEINKRLRPLIHSQTRCLQTEILPALAAKGIVIKFYRELRKREKKIANEYFRESIFPILTPQTVDPGHPFPYISNLSLNLGVMVEPPSTKQDLEPSIGFGGTRFARIKLPPSVPRLVKVAEEDDRFVLLGSLIAANVDALFPKMRTSKCHLFRITRDADFEIKDDEAGDLMR